MSNSNSAVDSLIVDDSEIEHVKPLSIRCPVHRYITFTSPMMRALINTKAFQRLRDITQLGPCTKLFPSANHKRFEHCLGVAHLCIQYAKKFISKSTKLIDLLPTPCNGTLEDLMAAAGLLHDIAHGPFSHDWDRSVYSRIYPGTEKGHDEVRKMIIRDDPEIADALLIGNLTPQNIIDAWTTKPISQMISGPLSADQMDYVCRDSKSLGIEHFGGVDPMRMISNAIITKTNDRRFRKTCRTDIEIFLRTRELSYKNVYLHHKVNEYAEILRAMMTKLIDRDPHIVEVEMRSALSLRKWTETFFFFRYLDEFGADDPLYEQWAYRELK
jgi:HD superfamily phosphohydrolase